MQLPPAKSTLRATLAGEWIIFAVETQTPLICVADNLTRSPPGAGRIRRGSPRKRQKQCTRRSRTTNAHV